MKGGVHQQNPFTLILILSLSGFSNQIILEVLLTACFFNSTNFWSMQQPKVMKEKWSSCLIAQAKKTPHSLYKSLSWLRQIIFYPTLEIARKNKKLSPLLFTTQAQKGLATLGSLKTCKIVSSSQLWEVVKLYGIFYYYRSLSWHKPLIGITTKSVNGLGWSRLDDFGNPNRPKVGGLGFGWVSSSWQVQHRLFFFSHKEKPFLVS